jgi:hypothetical protein
MRLKFAVTKSTKTDAPLHVYRVPDNVKVGDLFNEKKIILTFCHQELVSNRRLRKKSERGNKELELLVALMEFARAAVPASGTELERLITTAFLAGEEHANAQNKSKTMEILQKNL